MWHEARKHEKKLRGMMVDYRRRAERRREFYESIRRDPASFLQIHGQQMKIHIDPAISQAAESSLMPWMGDTRNMIDRFDVRAHLDYIPTSSDVSVASGPEYELTGDQEGQLNYERFRNLVQNDFLNITELKYLNQIYLEERCGQNSALKQKSQHELKKKLAEKKAAIGYNYEENDNSRNYSAQDNNSEEGESDSEGDEEEEFEDMDTTVHIDQLNDEMRHRISQVASKFGVKDKLFLKFLNIDKEEAEKLRIAKEIENEKAMFVGRKSRRERKELKQQRLLILRSINVDDSVGDPFGKPDQKPLNNNLSDDSSEDEDGSNKSEIDEGKVEFITCFGSSSEEDIPEVDTKKADKKTKSEKKEKSKKNKNKSKVPKVEPNNKSIAMPMFGPSLPCQKETGPSLNVSALEVKFNSTNNLKNRHYRYSKRSDDEEIASVRERTPIQDIYRRGRPRSSERRRRDHSASSSSPERPSRSTNRRYRSRSRSRSHGRGSSYRSSRYNVRRRSHSRDLPSRYQRRSRTRSRSPIRSRRYRSKSRSHEPNYRSSRSEYHRRSRSHSKCSRDRKLITKSRSPRRSRSTSRHRTRTTSKVANFDRQKDNKNNKKSKMEIIPPQRATKKSPSPKVVKLTEQTKLEISSIQLSNLLPINLPQSIPMPPEPEPSGEIALENTSTLQIIPKPKIETLNEPPPIRRYYRHDLAEADDLTPELSEDEALDISSKSETQVNNNNSPQTSSQEHQSQSKSAFNDSSTGKLLLTTAIRNSISNNASSVAITPQERLRRLMQAQLDKEYKRDKKAEAEKLEKQKQEKMVRDEELYKITNRLNEKRYRGQRDRSRSSSYSSDSPDSSGRRRRSRKSRSRSLSRTRHRSRSRSPIRSRRYRSRSRSHSR